MANKRDTSKQKRARQNRAQRDALKARTDAASVAPEERRTRASAAPAPAKGAKPRREPQPRPIRPGDVPVDVDTLEGNWLTKRNQVPGGRQVMMAAGLATISSVMLLVQKYPIDEHHKKRTETLFDLVGARAWPLVLFPIVVTAIAAAFALHPRRRRIWVTCAFVLGAGCFFALSLYLVHLMALGFLVYGIQRASKVEGPPPGSRAARGRKGRPAVDDAEAASEDSEPGADAADD